MVEPQRLTAGDTCDGDAMRPTGGPDLAPADVEPPLCRAPLTFDVQHIPVDKVLVVETRRAVNDEAVTQLVQSIGRIGLQTPITVRIQEDVAHPGTADVVESAYVVVAGRHRLEACRKLGWQDIPVIVHDCGPLEAQLWEIEENLARAELTPEEKAEHTVRLAAVIQEMEESLKDSDFPKQGAPATGRGHKGTIQKVAERIGVNQGTVRHRTKKVGAVIDEPV